MIESSRKRMLAIGLVQIVLVALATVMSYYLTRQMDIIPKVLLSLPDVYVSAEDKWRIVQIFCVVFLVQVTASSLIYRSHAFSSPRRFANEYLFYLFAYTTASLYAFLATTINYDAQFIASIGLLSTVLYFIGYGVAAGLRRQASALGDLWRAVVATLRRILTIPGFVAIIYFLAPLGLGMAFTKDRDIANRITQIRIWFNPVDSSDWGFRNFLPGMLFEQPVLAIQAPGDAEALYVLERVGRIYRVLLSADRKRELVLDIRDQLGEVEMENGAIGLAFHPRFNEASKAYQFAYLYYTDTRPEGRQVNRLSRFDLSGDDPAERRASEQALFALEREDSGFHNGGSIIFGPDNYLYVAFGEGVRTPEGKTSAQVLRGGIVRIDVDENMESSLDVEPFDFGTLAGYRIPPDNPFINNPSIRNEYWALGLRNPFRMSFDSDTGDLWVGDVGSTIWEEINKVEAGKHYGYPVMEGREATGKSGWESLGIPFEEPIYTYAHSAYDRAVIGGIVYRGALYEPLKDQYLFADNYSAKLFAMPSDVARVDEVTLLARANQYAQRGVSSVTQLASGEILVTTLGAASEPGGEVLMLVKASEADVADTSGDTANSVPRDYDEAATASSFGINCGRCHGINGAGDGPDSDMLDVQMPDLTSPIYHAGRSDEQIHKVIAEGGAALGMSAMMPPWEGFLAPQEIEHLVIYIRSLPDKHHRH